MTSRSISAALSGYVDVFKAFLKTPAALVSGVLVSAIATLAWLGSFAGPVLGFVLQVIIVVPLGLALAAYLSERAVVMAARRLQDARSPVARSPASPHVSKIPGLESKLKQNVQNVSELQADIARLKQSMDALRRSSADSASDREEVEMALAEVWDRVQDLESDLISLRGNARESRRTHETEAAVPG
jgi:FtsZ-binding cell division protein ZapB